MAVINKQDYEISNINLAPWGRKEILIAQEEMPALMSIRHE
ncbi:MAG: adenosylhomocysteinase, partial [Holophagaceae bacterium]